MSHAIRSRAFKTANLVAAGLIILLCAGCWNPLMVHPYVYESGRVLKAKRVELVGHVFAAGSAAVGLGRGLSARATYGHVGDNVVGPGIELTRSIYSDDPFYFSATVGADRFWALEHNYNGHRLFGGITGSWYPGSRRFGLHLPLRAYWMSYDWGAEFGETSSDHRESESGEGVVFVPGLVFSLEWDHVAVRAGFSGPNIDHIDHVELFPYWGAQVSLILGKAPERPKPPDEFSSR
jgi:hypothetical protein